MGNNNQIKYPKQHPVLRNVFACIMTILFVVPLLVTLIGFGVKKVNDQENIKTETTIGEILHYYIDTDRNGNANYYNTEVSYNIDGVQYSKEIRTRYYVADEGNKVVLYYAKGNPFSVVFTVQEYDFGLDKKIKLFTTLSTLCIIFFIYKAYEDADNYSRQIMMAQQNPGLMNNNSFNGGSFGSNSFNGGSFGGGMNSGGFGSNSGGFGSGMNNGNGMF